MMLRNNFPQVLYQHIGEVNEYVLRRKGKLHHKGKNEVIMKSKVLIYLTAVKVNQKFLRDFIY